MGRRSTTGMSQLEEGSEPRKISGSRPFIRFQYVLLLTAYPQKIDKVSIQKM